MLLEFVDAQASPTASETSPPATTSLVPLRTASLVPSTEVIPVKIATGSNLHAGRQGPVALQELEVERDRRR